MDPEVALQQLRKAVKEVNTLLDDEDEDVDLGEYTNAVEALVQSADALDMWMSKGGFAPKSWPQRTHCAGCGDRL